MRIAEANLEQARAWDGAEGQHWAEHSDWYEALTVGYDGPLFDAADIAATDRVLDLGCGTGASTRRAARLAPCGVAVGVDLSARMIMRAREQADRDRLPNATFLHADAQVHRFEPAGFDVAISRTGAMFFGDPVAAFANVAAALRPGGRLTLLAWRALAHNPWLLEIRAALAAGRDLPTPPTGTPGPFGLADPSMVLTTLAAAGFTGVALRPVDRPVRLGTDPDNALRRLADTALVRGMLDGLGQPVAAASLARLRATLTAHATPGSVTLASSAWLITARR